MREVTAGGDYDRLPESFVVFLCSQDPFGYDLPVYHLERRCDEVPELRLGDASHWLALNARAWEDAPGGDLLDLLRYAQTGKALGSLSRKIEAAVGRANEDREWVDKVWSVSTIVENAARRERINGRIACEEAREEGRQEGRQEGLEEGSARFAALASRLIEAGRVDDLAQAASDPVRRDELFREFDL